MTEPEKLASALRDRESEPRVKRMWDRIDAARRPRAVRRGPRVAVAGMVAIAAAAALVIGLSGERAPGVLTVADGAPLPGAALSGSIGSGSVVALSDGSRIEAGELARLDVLESSPRTVALGLRRGRVRFSVTPGGPRAWHVECGAVTVDVVGTVFTVDRDGDRVAVSVERGSVLVRGDGVPDHVQRVDAGGAIEIGAQPAVATRDEATIAPSVAADPVAERAIAEPAFAELAVAIPSTAVPSTTVPSTTAPRRESDDPVADLLARADTARRGGRHEAAARLLDTVVAQHADDPRAALAAYSLGRLRLERTGELRSAARTFARALELGLPEELVEGARAGRAIALARAHDPGADRALEEYLEAHPDGRSRAEVLRWQEAP